MAATRIISLLPAWSELVHAFGRGECLVGRSHVCDWPPEVLDLPVCSQSRLATPERGEAAAIQSEMEALGSSGTSPFQLDLRQMRELRPDLVLTQDHCAMCAPSPNDLNPAVKEWGQGAPQVLALQPSTLAGIWEAMGELARAIGAAGDGRDVIRGWKTQFVDIIQSTCMVRKKPTVVCLEWTDPLMASGNWIPEMVQLAGGNPVLAQAGAPSPRITWEEVREANPAVLVVLPCGWDMETTRSRMDSLQSLPGWGKLQAVRTGRVHVADGVRYFNRPGSGVSESLRALAEMIHPDLFPSTLQGKVWSRWEA